MLTLQRTYELKNELARFKAGDYVIFKTCYDLKEMPYVSPLAVSGEKNETDFVPDSFNSVPEHFARVSAGWNIVTNKMWKRLGGELARISEIQENGRVFLEFEDEYLTEFASKYTIQTWMVKHPFNEGWVPDLWYTPWKRTKLRSISVILTDPQKKALGEERIRALKSNAEFLCDRVLLQLMGKELDNPIEKKYGVVRVFCPELGEEYETLLDFLHPLSVKEMSEVEIPNGFYDKYKDVLFSEWEKYQDRRKEADGDGDEDENDEELVCGEPVDGSSINAKPGDTTSGAYVVSDRPVEDTKDRSVCAFLRVGDRVRVRDDYPADWKFEGGVKGLHCNLEILKLLYSGFDAIVEEVFADGVSLSFRDSGRELERLTWKAKQGGLVFPFWCLEFRD